MNLRQKNTRQNRKEAIITGLLFLISMVSVVIFLGIAFYLIRNGVSDLSIRFIATKTSVLKGSIGIWEYLVNTILLLVITLPVAGIIGVFSAVYLCEYVNDEKTVERIHFAIEILTGIPSIVFGLFGMVFFGEFLHMGYSLLTGVLTLTIMILPIMIENTKEILQTVPKEHRMGALGLGAGKWHMIRTILLPESISGIAAGLTLSAGKILGESAALLFTAGSKGSLAVALYMMVGKGQFQEAYSVALVLLLIIVLLNLGLQYIRDKYQQAEEERG